MSEKFGQQPPSNELWKQRGTEEKPYRARKISHEANTSIEYGEKTWTTAQTVRDLMQNHLDAETERYYQQVAGIIFDENGLKKYFSEDSDDPDRRRAKNFLHGAFTFAKYVGDMTPETRLESEEYLKNMSYGLSIKNTVQQGDSLSPSLFLEAVRPLEENRPLVSYEITDTQSNASIGWVAYETLRDEPMYQLKGKNNFRYKITGMKIADHGAGFDSQLSALYLSSKTGKRHLRGKFGEGAKMSELHLLRNGASMKMRSRYTLKSDEATEQSRVWQIRPRVEDNRLVSRGVEVEQENKEDTGSAVSISLRGAKESFRKDFLDNSDPRLNGLEKNIADFRSQEFSYPMPITEEYLSGVDMSDYGDVQYVQGLRVELAEKSFGYDKPWFSYNFLDSKIIGGRDRNEIKGEIIERIKSFWENIDSPELLKKLAHIVAHDSIRGSDDFWNSPERTAFCNILAKENKSKSAKIERAQKIIDDALLHELTLEKNVHTLILSSANLDNPELADRISYAEEQGYKIKTTMVNIDDTALEAFAKRLSGEYKIVSFGKIENEIKNKLKEEEGEMVEGEREKEIRKVFLSAVDSVNEFVIAAGMEPKSFELEFEMIKKVNNEYEYGEDEEFFNPTYNMNSWTIPKSRSSITIDSDGYHCMVRINPYNIFDLLHSDLHLFQKNIEIYLLSVFARDEGLKTSGESMLKDSQQLLDTCITKFIPEDAPILLAMPKKIEYEKDPAVFLRLIESVLDNTEVKNQKDKNIYEMYRKAMDTHLTSDEAQTMYKKIQNDSSFYNVIRILKSRVFLNDEKITFFNKQTDLWEKQGLKKGNLIAKWRGLPVYQLNDGRYFIQASMEQGAVLAKGEGKKREYVFSEGNNFLYLNSDGIGFEHDADISTKGISVHPAGLTLSGINKDRQKIGSITPNDFIDKQLEEYNYYPMGVTKREGSIDKRIFSTAIPIEYGQDEWNNPIRVFQDVIQNHIDASEDAKTIQLTYEVERNGDRTMTSEADLLPDDRIIGLTVEDSGLGYYPNDIATMGASSKKSPLFAGKYGEGQKMIAAAALRNGLELTYKSTVQNNSGMQSWSAQAVEEARLVVLDGKEVEKKLVAFDVRPISNNMEQGSATTLRLPPKVSPSQESEWEEWVSIIDPRQKDRNGNGGLARYARQLRQPGSERVCSVGSISVLLDEPGAVYENGLRINPQAEAGRSLSFGYDVPEIVTTRERNSYNPGRLNRYIRHVISNIENPFVIEEILYRVDNYRIKTFDLNIGDIMNSIKPNAAPIWAGIAKKIWPGYVVHSSKMVEDQIFNDDDYLMAGYNEDEKMQKIENAKFIKANMAHLDKNKVLDVPKNDYYGFSKLLPTAESVIERFKTEVLPAPPVIKKILSSVVAESTKVFADMRKKKKETLTKEQLEYFPISEDKISKWSSASDIESKNGVAIAPLSSAYHGKADKGVIFNEALLFEGKRRDLAETSLHEMAHILSGYHDYEHNFVLLLYEVAQHFAKKSQIKK